MRASVNQGSAVARVGKNPETVQVKDETIVFIAIPHIDTMNSICGHFVNAFNRAALFVGVADERCFAVAIGIRAAPMR